MTYKDRLDKALKSWGNAETNELDALIKYAYWRGREDKAKERAKVCNARYAEQIAAAEACRYHEMAMRVVMSGRKPPWYAGVYAYDPDYSGDYGESFGGDTITNNALM